MRRHLVTTRKAASAILIPGILLAAAPAWSARVLIPEGTVVYAELGEEINSNQDKFPIGFQPKGHVWRDVVVGGITVIEAGTPIVLMISDGTQRSIGARAGAIEISAMYVNAVGGAEITLIGGYGQVAPDSSGVNQALGASLSAAAYATGVFSPYIGLPTAFLPGRKAVLEEGTVFDAAIPADTYIDVPDAVMPTLNLRPPTGLTVSVIHEEVTSETTQLPLAIQFCGEGWTNEIYIEEINDESVRRIPTSVFSVRSMNNCINARATVDLDALTGHFEHGINRFEVTVGEDVAEVVLNVEM
jgi:hypothetical protein